MDPPLRKEPGNNNEEAAAATSHRTTSTGLTQQSSIASLSDQPRIIAGSEASTNISQASDFRNVAAYQKVQYVRHDFDLKTADGATDFLRMMYNFSQYCTQDLHIDLEDEVPKLRRLPKVVGNGFDNIMSSKRKSTFLASQSGASPSVSKKSKRDDTAPTASEADTNTSNMEDNIPVVDEAQSEELLDALNQDVPMPFIMTNVSSTDVNPCCERGIALDTILDGGNVESSDALAGHRSTTTYVAPVS